MPKTIQLTRNILGSIWIVVGAIGMWWKHPLLAAMVLLSGICLLPSLYNLIPFKIKWLSILLPTCCILITVLLYFFIPPSTTVTTAFPPTEKDTTYCYVTPKGTRYHFTRSCAGKYNVRLETKKAAELGYTPCVSCCKNK